MIPGLSWAKLIAFAVVLVIAGAVGWQLNGWRLGTQLANNQAAYAANLKQVSDAATAAAQAQEQKLEAAQQAVATLDVTYTEEMQHVQADAQAAHAALADGSNQLSIRATCPAASGNSVSKPAATASVVNDAPAGRAVINRSDAQTLVALAAAGDGYRVQLSALQAYVRAMQSPAPGHQ